MAYVESGEKSRIFCSARFLGIGADPNAGEADNQVGCIVEAFLGSVTVYLVQKTPVYRHNAVDRAGLTRR